MQKEYTDFFDSCQRFYKQLSNAKNKQAKHTQSLQSSLGNSKKRKKKRKLGEYCISSLAANKLMVYGPCQRTCFQKRQFWPGVSKSMLCFLNTDSHAPTAVHFCLYTVWSRPLVKQFWCSLRLGPCIKKKKNSRQPSLVQAGPRPCKGYSGCQCTFMNIQMAPMMSFQKSMINHVRIRRM